ncbi:MAG TPA: endonuclease Q family protein [Candidatus Saccharimonadales bacterium]
MELIVDLHIHSHFSRATSRDCTFEGLYKWGKLKGISVIGTGDFTHPQWFAEMREKLVPTPSGLFALREEIAAEVDKNLPESVRGNALYFVPSIEIATIYKKNDRVRKLHQLIIMPTFEAVSELNARLERIGNLKADGRPILGLDSKELLKMALDVTPETLFIPAHIWTPWFGLFGSKSGFDNLEEAYEELAPEIHAIETGLSSDPPMNWRVSDLDNITIISNSDAHSPQKLGREATIVNAQPTYEDVVGAIKTNDARLVGTIEFFPHEGKYFASGHRACNVRLDAEEVKKLDGICPVCHKPLVVGVDYRVGELASRPENFTKPNAKKVEYIIPLPEIIAELKGVKSVGSKAVVDELGAAYAALGDEFSILRKISVEEIRAQGFELLALAVERLRAKDVVLDAGYDGVYGTIKIFKNAAERQSTMNQLSLL